MLKLKDQIELLEGINERTVDITVWRLRTALIDMYERMNDMQEEINNLHNELEESHMVINNIVESIEKLEQNEKKSKDNNG